MNQAKRTWQDAQKERREVTKQMYAIDPKDFATPQESRKAADRLKERAEALRQEVARLRSQQGA